MKYRPLGRSGLSVSSIALGCVTFGREIDQESSFVVMDHALDRGINLWDTAEVYAEGGSEEVVGAWLKSRNAREKIVLATKASPPYGKRIIEAAEASLRRLQTDVIDLYQLHAWDDVTPLDETLEALNRLVEQGKVRSIGCSNHAAWQLCKSLWRADVNGWARMESIQPNYNLVIRDIETEIVPCCASEQVGILTYSPLGAGFLTGKHRRDGEAPQGTRFALKPAHQSIYYHDRGWRVVDGLRAVSQETGRSMINLAMAWVIEQPGIASVLIGARTPAHVEQAFEAEQIGLEPALQNRLSNL